MKPGLRGQSLVLRAVEKGDLEALRAFVNDPDVMYFSNTYRPISDSEQESWWQRAVQSDHAVWFSIDAEDKLIGTCCLVDIDAIARVAELRIRLGDRSVWGKGYGTEACRLLIEHGFRTLNLERIWLRVFDNNLRAQKVYEKLGFVVEGRLRAHAFIGGQKRDVIIMGLLRSEWPP